jgi:hypothetical protein
MSNKVVDLTGKKFGLLTAQYICGQTPRGNKKWFCYCDCGKTAIVASGNLRSGGCKNCGCVRRMKTSERSKKSEIGNRYGRLKVVSEAETKEKNLYRWNCLCDCGKTITRSGHYLRRGNIKSCGCLIRGRSCFRFKDLSGKVFGRLTVLDNMRRADDRRTQWNCLCKCGKKVFVETGSLLSGVTRSCGCFALEILRMNNQRSGGYTRMRNQQRQMQRDGILKKI